MVLFPPTKNLNYDVSLGSMLGLLLSLILKISLVIKQYADDTCIIVKARNTAELKFEPNALLSRIEQWSSANKLTIVRIKQKHLIFSKN